MTRDLPQEVAYLEGYDEFSRRVQEEIADMPERVITLLVQFLRQNNGALSKRAYTREFRRLSPDEVERVEELYRRCFAKEVADRAG